jgi:prolyl-tRNA editing enzyme YbaK/EbsC (Cys-tRNA(Pro) deacylase)
MMIGPKGALPASAQKVQDAALALGLDITIMEMATSTRTAQEAAMACGCDVAQIVKSLVFRGAESGKPRLALVSGTNRFNEKGMATALGEALIRPDAAYVRKATGFAIGGVPPFGHPAKISTVMDEDLLELETVWAAAGTPHAVFSIAPSALADAVDAQILKVT